MERKKIVKKTLILHMIIGSVIAVSLIDPVFASSRFPDIDTASEYVAAVNYVSKAKIMVGDTDGNFNPHKTVTRAEMATIICNMLGEKGDTSGAARFTDVASNHWANPFICKAVELSFVSGYGDDKFGPSDNVTYEQAVTMIVRAIGGNDVAIEYGGYPNGYVFVASENGLLEGINAKEGEALSRIDIAAILYRYYLISSSAD